jgi:hypothetical protein
MFLMPVCFYSHPNLSFHSLVCSGGEFQIFSHALKGAPFRADKARIIYTNTKKNFAPKGRSFNFPLFCNS